MPAPPLATAEAIGNGSTRVEAMSLAASADQSMPINP
jgi:hypothetical protein